MKSVRAGFFAIMVLLVTLTMASPVHAGVSFGFFYSNLSPHGTWLVSAEYGRVWQPYDYGRGWSPYIDGHWVYADVGWTWVSDYEWGDVPYHYGTWFDDPRFGWVWVPGYTWAPAWVVFRTGPDYIGWAPVSPRFYVGGSWSYGAPASPFVFVPTRHFCEARVGRYVVPERQVRSIYGETRVANTLVVENNVVVNRGPDPRVIERASGRRLIQVPIESVPRAAPGGGVTRSAIAVNPRQNRSLRAAEPVPTEQSLPDKHQQEGGPHGTPPRVESVPRAAPRANTPPPASSVRPSHEAHPHDQHPPDTPHTPSAGAKPKPKPAPKAHGKPPAQDKPHGLELATPGPRR